MKTTKTVSKKSLIKAIDALAELSSGFDFTALDLNAGAVGQFNTAVKTTASFARLLERAPAHSAKTKKKVGSGAVGPVLTSSFGLELVKVEPLGIHVGKYPVTQEEFEKVTGKTPSYFKGARRPVEQVSWLDAVDFCERATKLDREAGILDDGQKYSLPTDEQFDVYVGDATLADAITSQDEDRSGTADVGTLGANQFGLHDVRGNVWEWMADWYTKEIAAKDSSPSRSYIGEKYRVLRGGSWGLALPEALAVAYRGLGLPDRRLNYVGFRVVVVSAS